MANESVELQKGSPNGIATLDGSGNLPDGQAPAIPSAHSTRHENGGADEISVASLSGELADPQPPKAHKANHENGGSDEISVAGLSGLLADAQTPASHVHAGADVTTGTVAAARLPTFSGPAGPGIVPDPIASTGKFLKDDGTFASTGLGTDENVKVSAADTTAGYLDASLAVGTNITKTITNPAADEALRLDVPDASLTVKGAIELATQVEVDAGSDASRAVTPATLASAPVQSHTHGAADVISGAFDPARLPAATTTAQGAIELATQAEVNAGTDTTRAVTPSTLAATTTTPEAHATSHENGGGDEISVAGLSGLLADDQNPTAHTHAAADVNSGTLDAARLPAALTTAIGGIELATQTEVDAGTDSTRAVTPSTLAAAITTRPDATIAESTSTITTTSASDVLVTSMTLTPVAATYMVHFSGVITHDTNDRSITVSIYSGGVQVAASVRPIFLRRKEEVSGVHCMALVTVNGAQAIEARWKTSGATATMTQRQILISEAS